jgi:deoxyribonuclease V
MNRPLHSWNLSPSEAVALQQQLRARVVREDRLGAVRHVAGTDVGFERSGSVTRAAVAVLRLPGLELVDQALAHQPTRFPYVPGLLSFREAPAVLAAFGRLRVRPDLILCDGQGIAHPRRMGIASHIGLWLDIPAVGVGKTRLTGVYAEPAQQRGAWTPLTDGDEILGAALRTRPYTRPLFISTGHRISLETAVKYVMACITRYRLPETTRWSHRLASATPPSRKRA